MRYASRAAALAAAGILTACAQGAAAQALRDRVARAPDGTVHILFAARGGVCGDGQTFLRSGGTMVQYGSIGNGIGSPLCDTGPVRVAVTKAGGTIISLRTYAGPVPADLDGTRLGQVPAADAAAWLLGLAATLEGRPAREAIMPAMLADSANVLPGLLALVRNGSLPYEVRSSATSWLAGQASSAEGGEVRSVISALEGIARNDAEPKRMRSQALSALGRMDAGLGIEALLTLRRSSDPWVAQTALSALASSGDPRARPVLREVARDQNASEDMRVAAIRGVGRSWATPEDAALLRTAYASETSRKAQDQILSAIATLGGTDNVQWLLQIARSSADPTERSKAIRSAQQAGASSTDLVRLYDAAQDRRTKEAVISALVTRGDRVATDKLIDVARTETDLTVRRNVIKRIGNSDDPRVKAMLQELIKP